MYKGMICHTILYQRQDRVFITSKTKAIVPLIEQMLRQIEVIYSDREEKPTNKFGKIDMFGGDNMKMADKVVYENMRNTTSQSRLEIQLIENRFQLIRFNDGKRG